MLTKKHYAEAVLPHGLTLIVTDPHVIRQRLERGRRSLHGRSQQGAGPARHDAGAVLRAVRPGG
ncbi:hypothetical protein VQ056_26240, partial [Paenibacillus sp. JTLBN-2024]